jgi:deoxycytidine triphosphate deaminase
VAAPFIFDASALSPSDEEAARRFAATRSKDPFPEILPALLNGGDLLDYVIETGMIYPFVVNLADPSETLKPASCGIPLLGQVRYWEERPDGEPRKVPRDLSRGEHLRLGRNSITYVTLAPMFRMPDYMAARFNLTIRDVYRGILLGTGPLVDPGFEGKLSIPLHNLTYNDYTVVGGEVLVWMEFTKLSPHPDWDRSVVRGANRRGAFVGFPDRKRQRKTVDDYLQWASGGEPIRSSIPALVGEAQSSARKAAAEAARIRNFSIGATLASVLAIAALVFGVYQAFNDISTDRRQLRDQVLGLQEQQKDDRRVDRARSKNAQLRAQRLDRRLRALEHRSGSAVR